MKRFIRSLFFGNYFIGAIAIALSIESCIQLRLPLNSITYYVMLFCVTIFYYTFAYLGPLNTGILINPRKTWYINNRRLVIYSQFILFTGAVVSGVYFLYKNFAAIKTLPFVYWLMAGVIVITGLLYYGLLPGAVYKINLRNTGWLKAFTIGFVWACVANLLSFIVVQVEYGPHKAEIVLLVWLFIKNFMFCTVNAIIFDIKDYADDSNQHLKTFVVRFGLRNTIFYVLLPLIAVGLLSLIAFASSRNFSFITIGINLLPFILLFMIAWSMQRPQKILYYLVVIDGLIFLKALCGIAGMKFIYN